MCDLTKISKRTNKEHLYQVGMKDKRTGKKFDLRIWAKSVDEATRKVTNALFAVGGEYSWTGSGPVYENNELVSREAKD